MAARREITKKLAKEYRSAALNPAAITRRITRIQQQLVELAAARTQGTRPAGLSYAVGTRTEITPKYARCSKKDKGRLLDEVVAVTGWSAPPGFLCWLQAVQTRTQVDREIA